MKPSQSKWLPLHTLAACGEFYLVHALLKHNVDINAVDKVLLGELLLIVTWIIVYICISHTSFRYLVVKFPGRDSFAWS